MTLLDSAEVAKRLGIGKTKALEIIKQLNTELTEKGFLTIPYKIPEKYLMERFYG